MPVFSKRRQFLLNRLMTSHQVGTFCAAEEEPHLQCRCQIQERQLLEWHFSCFKASGWLQGLQILQKSNLTQFLLPNPTNSTKSHLQALCQCSWTRVLASAKHCDIVGAQTLWSKHQLFFNPSEIMFLSDKNWKSYTYRSGKKILPFPRMRSLPWILFQEQDWVHGWVLLIPCTVFIAFIVARIVDGQWINITVCKAGVKYDFIYRNLSEIKDTASSPMRLLVGNPIDKGHKKQLATLHLKRNSASKWAKQVKTPLLRTADLI